MKQFFIALLFFAWVATIPLALSALVGCQAQVKIEGETTPEPKPDPARIEVETTHTLEGVDVCVRFYAKNDRFGGRIELTGRNEIDDFKRHAELLVQKLEEAQNEWEKIPPKGIENE
ncbi:MAG: hypothetical protein ACXADB_04860 [Candidatus Hermodarchaeia archaeon]|jgi:hypothetical protein